MHCPKGKTVLQVLRYQKFAQYFDLDEELYDTPPETLETESDHELESDDPNAPEISEDDITEDEDIDELQNRPENDTGISVGNLLNFPDLLRLNTSGHDTNKSETSNSDNETFPPSHSRGARPKSPLPTGTRSTWRHPLLSFTSLQEQKAVVSLLMMNHPNHGLDLARKRI